MEVEKPEKISEKQDSKDDFNFDQFNYKGKPKE